MFGNGTGKVKPPETGSLARFLNAKIPKLRIACRRVGRSEGFARVNAGPAGSILRAQRSIDMLSGPVDDPMGECMVLVVLHREMTGKPCEAVPMLL